MAGPQVTDATFSEVTRRLSSREIVELLMSIGTYLMLARVMTVLELEIDAPAATPSSTSPDPPRMKAAEGNRRCALASGARPGAQPSSAA